MCKRNNDVHRISEDVLKTHDVRVKAYVGLHSIDCEDEDISQRSQCHIYVYFWLCPDIIQVSNAITTQSMVLCCCWTRLELTSGIYE